MASFNFTVDTNPMAKEIKGVSSRVDAVSGSVIAMQAAVVNAEKEGANLVCANVNRGFYSLMQSQISQKIASLTSQVEAKLMDLGQQAIALHAIQNRMERDYNMISNRYGKLFGSLNSSLFKRVQELDKPVINLVHSDMKISESRIKGSVGTISTNQNESISDSQLIMASKTKGDGAAAITAIYKFIRDVNLHKQQSEAVITNVSVENICNIYLPISITESTTEVGAATTRYYAPKSNIGSIDEIISQSAQQSAMNATRSGEWEPMDGRDRQALDGEFSSLLSATSMDERVKSEIAKMYNATRGNFNQLKKSRL